jgi:iron-sulfur cluster repair protein YtfE (RIC family)
MDMFTLLKSDHEKVKKMFEEALAEEEIDKELVNTICEELLMHMEIEEKFLYPVMKKTEEMKNKAEEAVLEHKEGKTVIEALQTSRLTNVKRKVKLEVLKLEIEHHVEEEENEVFPELKRLVPQEQLQEIAEKMQAHKAKKMGKELAMAS